MTTRQQMINARGRVNNSSFNGAGATGAGDRGFGSQVAQIDSNPWNTNDFVARWRALYSLYSTSWECRKITRIPVEDALRKSWIAEGIPDEMAGGIQKKLINLRFLNSLKRSLIMERLFGGCLTFFGLEDRVDDPSKEYNPSSGAKTAFCNVIPISRIAKLSWCSDPLSEHYMRPESFLINGQNVHVSRMLVWDGEPLIDSQDFAISNWRVNLAGFGPSVIYDIWDDIIKAIGTRQAAYQLININNAILIAVQDLQDLSGTTSGQKALSKLKDIGNQLSAYRAALIDGDKVSVTQSAASFGSVPELLMSFLQVLSAASDIPASRFLGQAPGGLNATGDSDLENYYNSIDAYQQQRIAPNLYRAYDIIGYAMYPSQWSTAREKLEFSFPPLWNLDELKAAQAAQQQIANVMAVYEAGGCGMDKVIEEINAKGALSTKLDEDDIDLLKESGLEDEAPDAQGEIGKLKGRSQVGADGKPPENSLLNTTYTVPIICAYCKKPMGEKGGFTKPEVATHGICPECFEVEMARVKAIPPRLVNKKKWFNDLRDEEIALGMKDEQEHLGEVSGDEDKIRQIVMDHLRDDPKYYSKLRRAGLMNASGQRLQNYITESGGKFTVHAKSGKHLGTYDTRAEAEKRLGQIEYFKHQNMPEHPPRTHVNFQGLDVMIETPKGAERKGLDADKKVWSVVMPCDYGELCCAGGADGDRVDCYIGGSPDSDAVFIVDQCDPDTGEFDEHKVILGTSSLTQAKGLYKRSFSDGRGAERCSKIIKMNMEEFKLWLAGNTHNP